MIKNYLQVSNFWILVLKEFKTMKKIKGFTLVELLVVIAIIALLLSILMPALGRVKRQAQQTVCLTNLKQHGTSVLLYAQNFDDSFCRGIEGAVSFQPGKGYWITDLKDYRGDDLKTMTCPTAKRVNPDYPFEETYLTFRQTSGWITYSAAWPFTVDDNDNFGFENPLPISYAINSWATNPEKGSYIDTNQRTSSGIYSPSHYFWRKVSSVSSPAEVPMFGDGRWFVSYADSEALITPLKDIELVRTVGNGFEYRIGAFCFPRHSGANLLFADFSAGSVNFVDLWKLKWNRKFDTNNKYAKEPWRLPSWVSK
jgi:prepilin-type N-terminal cleavage/methylation domain-containing protein